MNAASRHHQPSTPEGFVENPLDLILHDVDMYGLNPTHARLIHLLINNARKGTLAMVSEAEEAKLERDADNLLSAIHAAVVISSKGPDEIDLPS